MEEVCFRLFVTTDRNLRYINKILRIAGSQSSCSVSSNGRNFASTFNGS